MKAPLDLDMTTALLERSHLFHTDLLAVHTRTDNLVYSTMGIDLHDSFRELVCWDFDQRNCTRCCWCWYLADRWCMYSLHASNRYDWLPYSHLVALKFEQKMKMWKNYWKGLSQHLIDTIFQIIEFDDQIKSKLWFTLWSCTKQIIIVNDSHQLRYGMTEWEWHAKHQRLMCYDLLRHLLGCSNYFDFTNIVWLIFFRMKWFRIRKNCSNQIWNWSTKTRHTERFIHTEYTFGIAKLTGPASFVSLSESSVDPIQNLGINSFSIRKFWLRIRNQNWIFNICLFLWKLHNQVKNTSHSVHLVR